MQLSVPSQKSKSETRIDRLLGANLTDSGAYMSPSFSPECPNMIRESPSKIRKRTGFHTLKTYPYRINGVHHFFGEFVNCDTRGDITAEVDYNTYTSQTKSDMRFITDGTDWYRNIRGNVNVSPAITDLEIDYETYFNVVSQVNHTETFLYSAMNFHIGSLDNVTFTCSSGLSATVSDDAKFKFAFPTDSIHGLNYSDGWYKGTEPVDLDNIGISLTGTPTEGDTMLFGVHYTKTQVDLSTYGISTSYGSQGGVTGTYICIMATGTECDLDDYGITVTGTLDDGDEVLTYYYEDAKIIHSGTNLYLDNGTNDYNDDTLLYSEANDKLSMSVQVDKCLCFFDGKKYLLYGKFSGSNYAIEPAEDHAYVPTTIISRSPESGGTTYEPINLIGKKQINSFLGVATKKDYYLTAKEIDNDNVVVKVMNAQGEWETKTKTTHYTVNTTTGVISFVTAPGVSPITGEDNVTIEFEKTYEGYADRINKCDICTLYGSNGARDRIFCSGNDNYANQDWYTRANEPAYFGDTWYSVIGQDGSKVMCYRTVNDNLATILDKSDDNTNIVLRTATVDDEGTTIFTLNGSYQGNGAINKHSHGVLKTEPIFLSEGSINALTPSDVLGERFSQERSYYIRNKLRGMDLTDSYGISWDDYFVLSAGEYLFLLDGLQPITEQNEPYSTRQYVAYYWTGINARILYTEDEILGFGTEDGKLKEFYTDYETITNFNDDGTAIYCCWKTPELSGRSFANKKQFKKLSALIASAVRTGCQAWGIYDDEKELISEYNADFSYFDFAQIDFGDFTFNTDDSAQRLDEKISIKPDNGRIQFLFENGQLNQPFGLYEISTKYLEKG